jgi:hypothetical protein
MVRIRTSFGLDESVCPGRYIRGCDAVGLRQVLLPACKLKVARNDGEENRIGKRRQPRGKDN